MKAFFPGRKSRATALIAVLALLAIVALAGCQLGNNPTSDRSSVVAAATPAPTDSAANPTAVPGAATTTPLTTAAPSRPVVDYVQAQIVAGSSGPPQTPDNPVLQGLSFWDSQGQQVRATHVLTATSVGTADERITKARWRVATTGTAGIDLVATAEQLATGVLSLEITPARPSGVTGLGVCLPAEPGEHFYGLGERFGHFDLAGHLIQNRTAQDAGLRTTYAPATFMLSSRGYGLYLETMTQAVFDLRTADRGCYLVRARVARLRLYFFAGPHPQTVLERHARLVGLPPLPPEWAFGVWKNLIGGQQRVLNDVQRLHDDQVPVDAIWIYDAVVERAGFGWPWQIYAPISPGSYPDLPGMIDQLQGLGLKVLGYLNPFVYPDWTGYDVARSKGYLVQTAAGQPYLQKWTFGQRSYLDFTNREASQWWQDRVRYALTDVGFDGAMLDFGEDAPANGRYSGEPGYLMDTMYPLLYHKAAYEAGQAAKPGDFVFFARAGYSGDQPYTTGRFTGDQVRNWQQSQGLGSVVPAVLNGSLSGWPYWGPDIAGFFRGKRAVTGPGEKELWIRWAELGALMPTMRDMYGAADDHPVEMWTDGETLAVFCTYAELHTALKPYLYRYAQIAHQRGLPIVRPLFLNYPDETETYTLGDEYLLGEDLLVAPVLVPGQRERSLYLPAGQWRYHWTGKTYSGPGKVTVPSPLHHIPLFVREGAGLKLPQPGN